MIKRVNYAKALLANKFAMIEGIVKATVSDVGSAVRQDAANIASGICFFDSSGNWIELPGKIQGGTFEAGNGYRIWIDAGEMPAYIEFGTGEYAAETLGPYPEDWKALAYDFYVNGKGKLPARPYMYPAYVKNTTGLRDQLISRIRRTV